MAVKSKTQLGIDISADANLTANQKTILTDMVDSYENIYASMNTATRDALTPTTLLIIYNTDTNRYEYWNGSKWFGIGENLATPIVVKIDLTSADILSLNATPIVVAPAYGSGYAILPSSYAYRYTHVSTPYGGGNIVLRHSSSAVGMMQITNSGTLSSPNSSDGLGAVSVSGSDVIYDNDDLILSADAAITAGDGVLTIWATYSIMVY